LVLE
jgi:hypothetical protein